MAKSPAPRRGKRALVDNQATRDRMAELGAVQYSPAEVADNFGASGTDLADFFADHSPVRAIYEQAVADARKRLRMAQFKLAEKSSTMAIFLGRQYLGQADRRELDASARVAEDAEIAEDAQFVRDALAALAADRGAPAARGSGEDGAGQGPPPGPVRMD